MPSLTTAQQGKLDLKPSLEPRLKRKLLTELKTYAQLAMQAKAVEKAMEKHKGAIAKLRDEQDEVSIEVDDFKVTLVAPLRSTLDKQKLIAQGVTTAQIEEATVVTPVRPYVKITLPGVRGGSDDE